VANAASRMRSVPGPDSLPRRFAKHLADTEVDTVFGRGWPGLENGEQFRAAEADYDVFVTADQNL
jgi:hypothetical protein